MLLRAQPSFVCLKQMTFVAAMGTRLFKFNLVWLWKWLFVT